MARKMTDIEIAEAIILLSNERRAAGKPIKTRSAAANIDKWLTAAALQPPVVPKPATEKTDDEQSGART